MFFKLFSRAGQPDQISLTISPGTDDNTFKWVGLVGKFLNFHKATGHTQPTRFGGGDKKP